MRPKAKIVCTIGPASIEEEVMHGLVRGGMNAARLNFSHGDRAFHQKAAGLVRKHAALSGSTVAIIQDLQGIKLRVGSFRQGSVTLKRNQVVNVLAGEGPGDESNIYIKYPGLLKATEEGHRILMKDGLIEMVVLEKKKNSLVARVRSGGVLEGKKGVNLPGERPLEISFTARDREDLRFGLRLGVDYVALSFVRRAGDVLALKDFLKKEKAALPVIAKIETPQALRNIDEILDVADGIMVARGDLGVEIPPEEVPIAQKKLIARANEAGRLAIVATEMLESLTERPRPTRAETTDVANAITDGADALMLSQETSMGKYPVEALLAMKKIIQSTEQALPAHSRYQVKGSFSEAVAKAAAEAAREVGARYIVAFTQSGYTARLVSMLRPSVDIIAFSADDEVLRQMALFRGVTPGKITPLRTMDALFTEVKRRLLSERLIRKGDRIVITAGTPNVAGTTSLMKLEVI
jgi:pyruvate kinase